MYGLCFPSFLRGCIHVDEKASKKLQDGGKNRLESESGFQCTDSLLPLSHSLSLSLFRHGTCTVTLCINIYAVLTGINVTLRHNEPPAALSVCLLIERGKKEGRNQRGNGDSRGWNEVYIHT